MDDFTRNTIEDILADVSGHDAKITRFFEQHIRDSEEEEIGVESLYVFKEIHHSVVSFLDSKIEEFKGMEMMGLDLSRDNESEEDEELLEKYAQSMFIMNEKVAIILEFFVDNLGEELVVEVLGLE